MQLIGMMDSPFVRRVAISLALLELPFQHRSVSVFRTFDEFARLNPVVKAPTLIDGNGALLIDSTLILDYLDYQVEPSRRLMPQDGPARFAALQIIGFALAATEKAMQTLYERELRPVERQHEPWLERVGRQMHAAFGELEKLVARPRTSPWLAADRLMQPDITTAVAWRFTQFVLPGVLDDARYPALAAFSARAENEPSFLGAPIDKPLDEELN